MYFILSGNYYHNVNRPFENKFIEKKICRCFLRVPYSKQSRESARKTNRLIIFRNKIRCVPSIFNGSGADPEEICNLYLILNFLL